MSVITKDLPDPLDPTPTMAVSNPDDLLSQMADEAIDRLMADADKGGLPTAPPVPMTEVAPGEPKAEALVLSAADAAAGPAAQRLTVAPVVAAEQTRADVPTATPAGPTTESTTPSDASTGPAVIHPVTPAVPQPAPDRQALLGRTPEAPRPSFLLLPLRLINAPFAGLSDEARRLIGLLGFVSLVPTACATAYLIWIKRH